MRCAAWGRKGSEAALKGRFQGVGCWALIQRRRRGLFRLEASGRDKPRRDCWIPAFGGMPQAIPPQ